MSWTDVANVVEKLAPTMASCFGGPLAGTAVAALEGVFGLVPKPDQTTDQRQDVVAAALTGATPDQLAAVRKADEDFQARMAELGFKDAETLASLTVQDRESARQMQVSTRSMTQPALAWLVIAASLALMGAIVLGAVHMGDPVTANMIGNITGYLFSESKAVLQFYFGSSSGSEEKTRLLAKAQPIDTN